MKTSGNEDFTIECKSSGDVLNAINNNLNFVIYPHLSSLNLCINIGLGILKIFKLLQTDTKIQYLQLRRNTFGVEGTTLLSEVLQKNTTLTDISLTSNNIVREDIASCQRDLWSILL
eukprot:TRINITY_DN7724_c0_g2_i1.p1 TRINITY_DN7724_c0_g2~~TRINITY_DN7724_c0_g2_i1.p1  ORF type:complete len:117 (-),score=16.80 TRINITY_DN7724_c0_g2_i1:241-591(-)